MLPSVLFFFQRLAPGRGHHQRRAARQQQHQPYAGRAADQQCQQHHAPIEEHPAHVLQRHAHGAEHDLPQRQMRVQRQNRIAEHGRRKIEQQQIQHDLLKGNGFLLDPHTFTIYVGKTSYVLPPNEGKILLTLLMNYPRTVSKEELFHALWGTDKFIDENALQVNFTRLRKTMRNYGLDDRIERVRGEGYRLKEQVDI